jgi:hypothetical protein
MEGFPEKITDTIRAVSSWLHLEPGDPGDASLSDSKSKSEKSSADEDASSSEDK